MFCFACWAAPKNVLVNQIFGVRSRMGMSILTFDWTQSHRLVGLGEGVFIWFDFLVFSHFSLGSTFLLHWGAPVSSWILMRLLNVMTHPLSIIYLMGWQMLFQKNVSFAHRFASFVVPLYPETYSRLSSWQGYSWKNVLTWRMGDRQRTFWRYSAGCHRARCLVCTVRLPSRHWPNHENPGF